MTKLLHLDQHPWLRFLYNVQASVFKRDFPGTPPPTSGNMCPTAWRGLWCLLFDYSIVPSIPPVRIATIISYFVYVQLAVSAGKMYPQEYPWYMVGFFIFCGAAGFIFNPMICEMLIKAHDIDRGFISRVFIILSPFLGWMYIVIPLMLIAIVLCLVIIVGVGALIVAGISALIMRTRFWAQFVKAMVWVGNALATLFVLGMLGAIGYDVYTRFEFYVRWLSLSFGSLIVLVFVVGVLTYISYKFWTSKFIRHIRAIVYLNWKKFYNLVCPKFVP